MSTLELEHHLRALDMTIKRGKKTESDREKRLAQVLGESRWAEFIFLGEYSLTTRSAQFRGRGATQALLALRS